MILTKEQIDKFIEINMGLPGFEEYSESEIWEIANGVANYYVTLFKIHRRLEGVEMGRRDETISNFFAFLTHLQMVLDPTPNRLPTTVGVSPWYITNRAAASLRTLGIWDFA